MDENMNGLIKAAQSCKQIKEGILPSIKLLKINFYKCTSSEEFRSGYLGINIQLICLFVRLSVAQ